GSRETFEPPPHAGRSEDSRTGHAPASVWAGTTGSRHHVPRPCPRDYGFLVSLADLTLDRRLEPSPLHAFVFVRRQPGVCADGPAHLGSAVDHSAHDPPSFRQRDCSSSF